MFFILRPGTPYRGVQLVQSTQRGSLKPATLLFGDHDPNTPLTWSLREANIVEAEKNFMRHMNLFRSGVGSDWYCGISKYYLQCNEAHNLRVRILRTNPTHVRGHVGGTYLMAPPRKDSIVIPLTDKPYQHTISAEDRDRILAILGNPHTTQWFCEGRHLFFPPGHAAQQPPIQMPVARAAPATPAALSTFIARNLVEHARAQPDAHCPISYDPFQECNRFCVGTCGHVYSDAAATLQTCPMCTQRVTWTAVEIAA